MKVTVPAEQNTQLPGSGSDLRQPSTRMNQSASRSKSWTARTGSELRICIPSVCCRGASLPCWHWLPKGVRAVGTYVRYSLSMTEYMNVERPAFVPVKPGGEPKPIVARLVRLDGTEVRVPG